MSAADAASAVDWARQEGWNPGLRDAAVFWQTDPSGFLMGRLDGEPVASISAVKYGADFGFIGLYIVRPAWRRQGLGWGLWQAAMGSLHGRNVALDGVVAQQDNYRKSGFVFAHRNVRYAGRVRHASTSQCQGAAAGDLVELSQLPFAAVDAFDQRHFPAPRSGFLRDWIQMPGADALGIVRGSALVAYGAIRPCHEGHKIGPLCAEHPALAARLLHELSQRAPSGDALFLDVPEPNAAAVALARSLDMTPSFETARMYTGPFPALPLQNIYGITTFELG